MIAGVFVELQRTGKAVKDLVGKADGPVLARQFQVVLGTDAGEHGDFFATQPLNASSLAVRQANVGGLEQFVAGSQKSCQLAD